MLAGLVVIVVVMAVPYVLWKAWLRLFPGISLRGDYGIRGGWFGTRVIVERLRSVISKPNGWTGPS